jgi:hypothetical protein
MVLRVRTAAMCEYFAVELPLEGPREGRLRPEFGFRLELVSRVVFESHQRGQRGYWDEKEWAFGRLVVMWA